MRRDGEQLLAHLVADVERGDEVVDGLLRHLLVAAGKLLQGLVGMRVSLATQDGLDGLSHDGPHIVEVLCDFLLI